MSQLQRNLMSLNNFFCLLFLYLRICCCFNSIKGFRQHIISIPTGRKFPAQRYLNAIPPASVKERVDSIPEKKLSFGLGKIAFSLLPLTPETVGRRKTLLTEIVKDSVWTLDQIQGIINVNVPVRGTIVRLSRGGLFVFNPVAPTEECIDFMRDLESKCGPVKFIVLSSLALEHKGTAGAFAAFFPKSSIYVQPGQFSFPVNLPTNFFFPFGKQIKEIPSNSSQAPWYGDLDHAVLSVQPSPVGGFGETAFFHRASKTLLVTDTIVKVEDEPPAIIQEDPRSILYHSRDTMLQEVGDSELNRRKGWRRMVLFGLFFQPAGIAVRNFREVFASLKYVSKDMRKLGEGAIPFDGGLYLWDWVKDDRVNFRKLQEGLLVAPILRKLLLNREPTKVSAWLDKVCKWPFQRIIPCHLSNNIKAGPSEFREAFDFLYENPQQPSSTDSSPAQSLVAKSLSFLSNPRSIFNREADRQSRCPKPDMDDLALLDTASELLSRIGVLKRPAPLLKR